MAYTQDDLDRIDRAISSGEASVRDGQTGVEYRGIDELIRARDVIRADLAAQARGATSVGSASGGVWKFERVGSRV